MHSTFPGIHRLGSVVGFVIPEFPLLFVLVTEMMLLIVGT